MTYIIELLIVGAGGFIGAGLRFSLTKLLSKISVIIPLGTLMSNIIAGFVIGLVLGIGENSQNIPEKTKLFLATGLLGGLSTFSAFSIENIELFYKNKFLEGFGNIFLNLVLSLLFTYIGIAMSKRYF